jgi:hypothetical protein
MNPFFAGLRWPALSILGFLLLAVTSPRAAAQEAAARYLFILRNPDPGLRPLLVNRLLAEGGSPAGDLFFPELGFIAIVGVFQQPVAIADNDPEVQIVRDVRIFIAGGPLGTGWVKNQFLQPEGGASCNDTPPVVYVVDTGISSGHVEFNWPSGSVPALTFAPGFSYARNTITNTPLPEYPDNHDHGTRVTGCLGGRQTGLLEALGGRAVVKSIAIFDTPAAGNVLAAWASQAINGVLRATTDHKARRALPWLKNRASVLVFAHATQLVDGRFAALDSAIEKAWQAGMHVVLSAGNEAVNAALVSPAGAAWGYTLPGFPPAVVRFWSGAPPPGAVLFRAAPEFTVTGGCDVIGGIPQLWPQTNFNAVPATAVDGYAPAANVPCAAAVGPPYVAGNGTSYSAGLAAAMLTWEAWMRPWATPAMARTWLNNSMTLQPGGWMKLETPVLPPAGLTWAEWIEQFYPVAVSTPAQRDPAGDPDADGSANFMEYFAGGDPRFVDEGLTQELAMQFLPGGPLVTVRMPVACHLPNPSQVTWALEKSSDLLAWSPVTTSEPTLVLPTIIQGDGAINEATGSLPEARRWFVRVKFTYTP